jgi:hypothetical protein
MKAPPMSRIFPDQHLATRRLLLRPYSVEDVDTVVSAAGDELTQRWLPLPQPYTREDAVHWCTVQAPEARTSGAGLVRAVTRDGRLVGSIDLKHTDWAAGVTEIGYWPRPRRAATATSPRRPRPLRAGRWPRSASTGSSCASRPATRRPAGSRRRPASAPRVSPGRPATCTVVGSTWSCTRWSAASSACPPDLVGSAGCSESC